MQGYDTLYERLCRGIVVQEYFAGANPGGGLIVYHVRDIDRETGDLVVNMRHPHEGVGVKLDLSSRFDDIRVDIIEGQVRIPLGALGVLEKL